MARVIRGRARVLRARAPAHDAERELVHGLAEVAREKSRLRETAAREIGTLALDVAARVIAERVSIDPALLERIVGRALARAHAESAVRVALHPDDRAALALHLEGRPLPPEIVLEDDPSQARGGCLVQGTLVTVDARVESVLAVIAHAMGVEPPT